VAMNPAAFVTNIGDLRDGGILIVNESAFDKKGLELAGLEGNPIEEVALHQLEQKYKVYKVDMTKLTRDAVKEFGMGVKEADRCRNFFAMGLIFWVYGRPLEPTLRFIEAKFGKKPEIAGANRGALLAGYNYGETVEAFDTQFHVPKAELKPGKYRSIMGNTALSWGLMTAAKLSEKRLFLGAYPITPASDILHELCKHKNFDIVTFQAEDEIAAMTATIGASFGGCMAITASSGPGIALKGEAFGLAVIMELPMVIVNVQRGGPSTGLPTKTEQSDLYQAVYGRNGECPMPVISARSPGDCFYVAQEAWRLAVRYMTPVMLLTDGYIANGSEPWRIPNFADLPKIPVTHPEATDGSEKYLPYTRDERLARPWAIPGTAGLEHRLGGLEKQDRTGNVSYDAANHQHMIDTRAAKVANIANDIPDQTVDGPDSGDLLVMSWGGTYGSCLSATRLARKQGKSVAHAHVRYINPLPKNLGELMGRYKKVLMPELNSGQLRTIIRDKYLVDVIGFNKMQGRPFTVAELVTRIGEITG
jgi:2-oxoglutarate ferredoxin oxidoreductase subunit alpha